MIHATENTAESPAAWPRRGGTETGTERAPKRIRPPIDRGPMFFEAHLFVCTNRRPEGHRRGSCAARGSEHLRDYMKARAKELGIPNIRVNSAGCLDRCELGPCLVIYPEGTWYRLDGTDSVDRILQTHVIQRTPIPELMLDPPLTPPSPAT